MTEIITHALAFAGGILAAVLLARWAATFDCLSCGDECQLEARRREALDRLMADDGDQI